MMATKKTSSAEKQIFPVNNTVQECNTIEMSPRRRFVSLLLLDSALLAKRDVLRWVLVLGRETLAYPQHRLRSVCSSEAPTEPIQRRCMDTTYGKFYSNTTLNTALC